VKGTAKLKICWFLTVKVRFDKTFGEERNTRLDDIRVLPLLEAALSAKGNWEAQPPTGRHALVSTKEIQVGADQILAHPSGILKISQKVVPLNLNIQKFGNQLPLDGNRFGIDQVWVGAADVADPDDKEVLKTSNTQEHFAPAQFFEKSDTQKLSSKSFERYDSGIKLTESEEMKADHATSRVVEYELFYIDKQRNQPLRRRPDLLAPDIAAFNQLSSKGSISTSPLSFTRQAKPALAPDEVKVSPEPFVVVSVRDLRPVNETAAFSNEAGAANLMRELLHNNPALEGEIQVVPAFEVNLS
jgi:hypothetical protein